MRPSGPTHNLSTSATTCVANTVRNSSFRTRRAGCSNCSAPAPSSPQPTIQPAKTKHPNPEDCHRRRKVIAAAGRSKKSKEEVFQEEDTTQKTLVRRRKVLNIAKIICNVMTAAAGPSWKGPKRSWHTTKGAPNSKGDHLPDKIYRRTLLPRSKGDWQGAGQGRQAFRPVTFPCPPQPHSTFI